MWLPDEFYESLEGMQIPEFDFAPRVTDDELIDPKVANLIVQAAVEAHKGRPRRAEELRRAAGYGGLK